MTCLKCGWPIVDHESSDNFLLGQCSLKIGNDRKMSATAKLAELLRGTRFDTKGWVSELNDDGSTADRTSFLLYLSVPLSSLEAIESQSGDSKALVAERAIVAWADSMSKEFEFEIERTAK